MFSSKILVTLPVVLALVMAASAAQIPLSLPVQGDPDQLIDPAAQSAKGLGPGRISSIPIEFTQTLNNSNYEIDPHKPPRERRLPIEVEMIVPANRTGSNGTAILNSVNGNATKPTIIINGTTLDPAKGAAQSSIISGSSMTISMTALGLAVVVLLCL